MLNSSSVSGWHVQSGQSLILQSALESGIAVANCPLCLVPLQSQSIQLIALRSLAVRSWLCQHCRKQQFVSHLNLGQYFLVHHHISFKCKFSKAYEHTAECSQRNGLVYQHQNNLTALCNFHTTCFVLRSYPVVKYYFFFLLFFQFSLDIQRIFLKLLRTLWK